MTLLPEKISALLGANFETGFHKVGEIPTEEWAGLGFGLSGLLAVSVFAIGMKRSHRISPCLTWQRRAALAAPFVSLLFFFAKSGMMTVARLVSAYYPLLLPALLRGSAQDNLVRRRGWRRAAQAVMLLAFPVVVLTPARPLWPAQTVFSRINAAGSNHHFMKRVKEVYLVYANRPDPLVPVRAALPDTCVVVGFMGVSDDTEISLWRPFGQRRVEQILPEDSGIQIRRRHIEYAVLGEAALASCHQTLQTWLQQHQAALVTSVTATLTVSDGPRLWHVVRLE